MFMLLTVCLYVAFMTVGSCQVFLLNTTSQTPGVFLRTNERLQSIQNLTVERTLLPKKKHHKWSQVKRQKIVHNGCFLHSYISWS